MPYASALAIVAAALLAGAAPPAGAGVVAAAGVAAAPTTLPSRGAAKDAAYRSVPTAAVQRSGDTSLSARTAPAPIDAPKRLASRSATFSLGV
jgi:hypothetical protein